MMAEDPLARLQPLREPDLIGWWPPAPGWWILGVLALVSLGFMGWWIWRWRRRNAYRRQALRQLRSIEQDYLEHNDLTRCIPEVNALLKSAALYAFPRREIAAASGESWLEFLNRQLPREEAFPPEFGTAIYVAETPRLDMDQVLRSARCWVKRHRGTTL